MVGTLDDIPIEPMSEPDTIDKTLSRFFDKNNLDYITEIPDAVALTNLELIAKMFEDQGYVMPANTIRKWVIDFKTNMISHQRKRTTEVLNTVGDYAKSRRSIYQKMLGNDDKKD